MTLPASSRSANVEKRRLSCLRLALFSMFCISAGAEVPRNAENTAESALPLPRWSEQELRAFRENLPEISGTGTMPSDSGGTVTDITTLLNTPIPSGPRLEHSFDGHDAELSPRLLLEDMRLFLPESILGQSVQRQTDSMRIPTPISSLKEVTPEYLSACNQALPTEYLIDPGMLVPEMQSQDMMRFMEFHARDARIKLYILITAPDCKLPEGVDLGKIASGSLLQTDACLLVYPLGEPWRSRLFVSKSVHAQTSTEFLSETIQSCVNEAMQASDVHDQLHRYAVHLSTRLFWLQKALGTKSPLVADKGQSLAEVRSEGITVAQNGSSISLAFVWSLGGLLLCGVIGVTIHRLHRHWQFKQRSRVWMLPEPETVPRLGGAFTGGGGGIIRYG